VRLRHEEREIALGEEVVRVRLHALDVAPFVLVDDDVDVGLLEYP
jgi:hypothetical protein